MADLSNFECQMPFDNLLPFDPRELQGSLRREGNELVLRLDHASHWDFWLEARIRIADVVREMNADEKTHGDPNAKEKS